jgi:hypothetical protein
MRNADSRLATTYAQTGGQGAYTGEFYPGPHCFDVSVQEAAFKWPQRHLQPTGAAMASLRDSRLLLCCALPRKVVFGETNQPNGERYRGQH